MTIRRFVAVGLSILGLAFGAPAFAASQPVVLELFTSNSCSSCPPAYELLRELQAAPPVDDVRLIVLSEHVDYWNDLGWVDRYSDARFSARQRDYAREVFGAGRVYTPQLVVNGRREMVGSRRGAVRAAIAEAAGQADLNVRVKTRMKDTDTVAVTATVAGGDLAAPATVRFALTQDNVVSEVGAGENGGRRLIEDGVVRRWHEAGMHPVHTQGTQSYSRELTLPADAERADLAVAAFVQREDDQAVVGANRAALNVSGAMRPMDRGANR